MRIIIKGARILLILAVFAIGVAIGTNAFETATARNTSDSTSPSFPKNENGQTYGSAADASSPYEEPDLIRARGVDGTVGYVLKKDLDGKKPKTPEEAIAQQRSAPESRVIPLYDVDGKTIIGKFIIKKGVSTDIPARSENS